MHLEVIESFVKLKQLQTDRLLPTFFLFMDSIIFRHEIEGYTAKEERVYLYAHFIQIQVAFFLSVEC